MYNSYQIPKSFNNSPSKEYCSTDFGVWHLILFSTFMLLEFNISRTVSIVQLNYLAVCLMEFTFWYTFIISSWLYKVEPSPPFVALQP